MTEGSARHLDWDGCLNLRDLGGLLTSDGRETARRAFVRGDSVCSLTASGRTSLLGYGVRTVVDLRSREELQSEPNPFAALAQQVEYRHRPLNDPAVEGRIATIESAAERYVAMVDADGERIAGILRAFVEAPVGGILFHCFAGRDRTGIVAALLLALAGVPDHEIVGDFEATDERMQPRYDRWRAQLEGERLDRFERSLAERGHPIVRTLEHLRSTYGGVPAYLQRHGFDEADQMRLVERVLAPAR